MSDKQIILNTVAQIDDATSYEEILYALYLQYEVSKVLEIWKKIMLKQAMK